LKQDVCSEKNTEACHFISKQAKQAKLFRFLYINWGTWSLSLVSRQNFMPISCVCLNFFRKPNHHYFGLTTTVHAFQQRLFITFFWV